MDQLLLYKGGKPFKNALIVGAGNGWVERELFVKGVVRKGVGIDFMQDFVDEANKIAKKETLPFTYFQHDVNKREPMPEGPFDLIINHAAAHHFGHIDFAYREMARVLQKPDGVYAHMDFVGPHRNQYNSRTWHIIQKENDKLPQEIRQELYYADIATMLVNDPSEAQHSEMIMETLRRYFYIEKIRPYGGAIAYPILTHNERITKMCLQDSLRCDNGVEKHKHEIQALLDADYQWMLEDPEGRSLFSFVIAKPLGNEGVPKRWYLKLLEEHEKKREALGTKQEYYEKIGHVDDYAKHP
mmetsp:Transcript_21441/g.43982  ORF Transcript_21441/g.43982 Transcript_21441/m.43982 type:complete len:299 (+) Transcript_21441:376-1272(+)